MDFLNSINWAQAGTILFSILTLYEVIRIVIEKGDWRRVFLGSLWGVHVLLFYTVIYADTFGFIDAHVVYPLLFTVWSSILRLHSAVTFYLIIKSTRTFMLINKKIAEIKSRLNDKSERVDVN